MALHVSLACQKKHIAQSIIYTLWRHLFLVVPSLEKDRTYSCVKQRFLLFSTVSSSVKQKRCVLECNGHRDYLFSSPECVVIKVLASLFHTSGQITVQLNVLPGSTLTLLFLALSAMPSHLLLAHASQRRLLYQLWDNRPTIACIVERSPQQSLHVFHM